MVSGNKIKIGISVDPVKRARSLTTASGCQVTLACIWKVKDVVKLVEKQLHKAFKKTRLEGEWFDSEGITPEYLEKYMTCPFERIYTNTNIF